jgi:Fe-S cluster assembly iron-binding protein IscA
MIKVAVRAREELEMVLKRSPGWAVRLFIEGFGRGGPRLGLALDEPKDGDASYNVDGLTFVIAKNEEQRIGGLATSEMSG